MVLHIKNYTLHGLINPQDHSNVNHISSLNLSNKCRLFAFIFIYCFSFFLLQGLTKGHYLGVVTRADSVTHWFFRRNDKAGS
jgi:hypothetical protein